MRIPFKTSARKSCTVFSEVIRPVLTGILIGAVLFGLYMGGKAAGRQEVLSADMWTDCCGAIYIDCGPKTVMHENLTITVTQRDKYR